MQKLVFHPAWDKTIAAKDRKNIEQALSETNLSKDQEIQFTTLQQAINHKGELLVISLIHNIGDSDYRIHNETFHYINNDKIIAEQTFSIADLAVKGKTSMPWTFIFPPSSFHEDELGEIGELVSTMG